MPLPKEILAYNAQQSPAHQPICDALAKALDKHFAKLPDADCKIWHRHPVWFVAGNPIVGYSHLKTPTPCIRLLFWSGQSFDEPSLSPEGSFKAAECRYTAPNQISRANLTRWLDKSIHIQWDYKNIVKRKGRLERLDQPDWRTQALEHIRSLIQQALPDVIEEIKWRKPSNPAGVPVWSCNVNDNTPATKIICTGETYKAAIKLTFAQGASLDDPAKLFNASLEGNTRRAIDITNLATLNKKWSTAFTKLIKAAAQNRTSPQPRKVSKPRAAR